MFTLALKNDDHNALIDFLREKDAKKAILLLILNKRNSEFPRMKLQQKDIIESAILECFSGDKIDIFEEVVQERVQILSLEQELVIKLSLTKIIGFGYEQQMTKINEKTITQGIVERILVHQVTAPKINSSKLIAQLSEFPSFYGR